MAGFIADVLVRIGAKLEGVKEAFSQVQELAEDTAKKLDWNNLSDKFKSVGKDLSLYVTAPLAAVGTAAVASFNSVDEGLDTIRVGTGATGKQLEELGNVMKQVGAETPASFKDIGIVISELNTRFGLTGNSLQTLTKQIVEMARITGTDVTTAVQGASHVFAIWGVEADKMQGVLDHLFKVSQSTGISISALNDALQNTAPVFKEMGLSVEETATLLGMLEKNGVDVSAMTRALSSVLGEYIQSVKSAQDGTDSFDKTLQSVISTLENSKVSSEQKAQAIEKLSEKWQALRPILESVGLDINKLDDFQKALSSDTINTSQVMAMWNDIMVEFKNTSSNAADFVRDAFEQLKNGTMSLDQAIDVFGTRAGPKLYELAQQGKLNFEEFNAVIQQNSETVLTAAEDTKDFGERFAELKNKVTLALEPLGVALAQALENLIPLLERATNFVAGLLNWFGSLPEPVQQTIVVLGSLAAAIGPVLLAVSGMIEAWQKINGLFSLLSAPGTGTIALTIAAIMGIVTIATLVIQNWDGIKAFFENLWGGVKSAFEAFWEYVQGFISKFVIQPIVNAWNGITNFFQTIWNGVKGVFDWWVNLFKTIISPFVPADIKKNWTGLDGFFKDLATNVTNAISDMVTKVTNFFSGLWNNVKTHVKTFVDNVTAQFTAVRDNIVNFVSDAVEKTRSWFASLWDKTKDSVKNFVENTKNWFKNMWDAIVGHSYVPDMIDGIVYEFNRLNQEALPIAKDFTQNVTNEAIKMDMLVADNYIPQTIDTISNEFNRLNSEVLPSAKGFTETVKEETSKMATEVSNNVKKVQEQAQETKTIFEILKDNIKSFSNQAAASLVDFFDAVAEGKKSFKDFGSAVKEFLLKMLSSLEIQVLAQQAAGIATAIAQAPATFGASLAAIPGILAQTATTLAIFEGLKAGIRALATGGIVTRPTLALIGEAGPEAVVPLKDEYMKKEVHIHVGTLIADELGLLELQRRLARVSDFENMRLGLVAGGKA